MDFTQAARQVIGNMSDYVVAPGMAERLAIAADPDGAENVVRSIAAPFHLTDLGVRRFVDPEVFLNAHLAVNHGWPTADSNSNLELLNGVGLESLAAHLDALILYSGDYETAVSAVRHRWAEVLESQNPGLLIYAGVLLASSADPKCRLLFAAASSAATRPADAFMARHRLAAAEIKRFGNPLEGMNVLQVADEVIAREAESGVISEGDLAALQSVTANLRALAMMSMGDRSGAATEVKRARSIATLQGLSTVDPAESARYAAQESINIAQMLVADLQFEAAIEELERNVTFCELNAPDYLGEALSACAYGHFLSGDHRVAIDKARAALVRIASEASPTRLRTTREILIAELAGQDDLAAAEHELSLLDSDPLGLAVLADQAQLTKPGATHA